MAQGTAIIDFGTSPQSNVTAAITGQSAILAGSLVEAWIFPVATADHSVDEHLVEEIQATAFNIIAGTGFSISVRGRNFPLRGKWSIGWVWA